MTTGQKVSLAAKLSLPAILAQFSSIFMQYIDASMVGSLGAAPSASIGIVSTTIWLFGGLLVACSSGFSVQVAHLVGANDFEGARNVFRQGITMTLIFSSLLMLVGCSISPYLPALLGGGTDIQADASLYFLIFALCLPFLQIEILAAGVLRCSGNLFVPSMLNAMMCIFDIIFNFFFIFPSADYQVLGLTVHCPGAGLGVAGAALGTATAELLTAVLMMYFAAFKSKEMRLTETKGRFMPTMRVIRKALHIGMPMGCERGIMCGAQIMSTAIVAPLGTFALAANTLSITAESLCYMPGYGIGEAATTLVGQSIGAKRRDLTWSFSKITLAMGMLVMTLMGLIMFVFAPEMIGFMSPVEEVRQLGTMALRIEAFAEPMFAASIVCYSIFIGSGDTLVPSMMNLGSIWAVRISLAALLAPLYGLNGVWIAMAVELTFRGSIFLIRLFRKKWLRKVV
jgi:putative MATE family efflux protein